MELTLLRHSDIMQRIVRRVVTILACLLLLVGGLQSPLIHLHPGQEHQNGSDKTHRDGSVVHSHFSDPIVLGHDADYAGLTHKEHHAEEISSFAAREPERS